MCEQLSGKGNLNKITSYKQNAILHCDIIIKICIVNTVNKIKLMV